jgi:hypothetical protein
MRFDETKTSRDPITVTIREACRITGLGPTTLWKLRKAGRLKEAKIAGLDRTLILFSSLQELLSPDAQVPLKRGPGRPRNHPLAVYDGRICIGFIRPRGGGFEALDLDRRSLGTFPSQGAAADAIEEAAS